MDGILMDGRTGRLWMCKKTDGHALGIVLRVLVDGHYVDRLLLFRNTLVLSHAAYNAVGKIEIKPRATIGFAEGTLHDVECEYCGSKRTWWIGEAALERFMEARGKRILSRIHGQETEKERV